MMECVLENVTPYFEAFARKHDDSALELINLGFRASGMLSSRIKISGGQGPALPSVAALLDQHAESALTAESKQAGEDEQSRCTSELTTVPLSDADKKVYSHCSTLVLAIKYEIYHFHYDPSYWEAEGWPLGDTDEEEAVRNKQRSEKWREFWGLQERVFRKLLVGMRVGAAVDLGRKALEAGGRVVFGIVELGDAKEDRKEGVGGSCWGRFLLGVFVLVLSVLVWCITM